MSKETTEMLATLTNLGDKNWRIQVTITPLTRWSTTELQDEFSGVLLQVRLARVGTGPCEHKLWQGDSLDKDLFTMAVRDTRNFIRKYELSLQTPDQEEIVSLEDAF